MARSDRTHGSERAQRLAVAPGEPAAGVLQPDIAVLAAALERVLRLERHAVAAVAARGLVDGIEAALPAFGVGAAREGIAAGDVADVGDAEHRRGIAAPDQGIGVEPPFIGDLTDRLENLGGVGDAGRGIETGHARPFLERRATPGVASWIGCSRKTTGNP